MKIALFSKASTESKWFRGGEDIEYRQNKDTNSQKQLHILSFTYEFLYDDDTIYMAFTEPYTFTDITKDITELENITTHYFKREILCTTIGGCICEMLTITSNKPGREKRKVVILTARVHSGETVSSWIMKGILKFLGSKTAIAEELLERCIFKIVPCLNPDGVIQGNYRCSLGGVDLNRKYIMPSKILHPSVYYLKKMVKNIKNPIIFYCDLHGHSKKKDVFAYGNNGENTFEYHLFPYLLSKINKYFSYAQSRFSISKAKASTARIAMWRELCIPAVYTIEASFYGPSCEDRHFSSDDLLLMGKSICQALHLYLNLKDPNEQILSNNTEMMLARKIAAELKEDPEASLCDKDDSGSDSNSPENEANIKEIMRMSKRNKSLCECVEIRKAQYEYKQNSIIKDVQDNTLKFTGDIKQRTIYKANVEAYKRVKANFFKIKNTQIISNNIHELINKSYKTTIKKDAGKKVQTRNIQKQSINYKQKNSHSLNLSETTLPKHKEILFKFNMEPLDYMGISRNCILPNLEEHRSSKTSVKFLI